MACAQAKKHMKKVLVIGSGGAGKSVLARHLGQVLDIDVIHLDALVPARAFKRT
jgi:shikimate kinase